MTMKHLLAMLLLLLGACAGGPITTDAELEWELAENSAEDQEYAQAGDAAVLALVSKVQAGIVALGEALAASGGPAVPAEVSAASEAIGQHVPATPAPRPDPAARPEDGGGWEEFLGVNLGELTFMAVSAALSAMGVNVARNRARRQRGEPVKATKT